MMQDKFDNKLYNKFSFDWAEKIDVNDRAGTYCHYANYSPILYAPSVLGIWFGELVWNSPGSLVFFGSLFSLIFYIVCFFFLIKRLNVGKWLLLFLALMPMLLHQAPSVSPDNVNNIFMAAVIVFLLNIFTTTEKLTKKQLCAIILIGVLSALTKVNNIFLLFPLLFLSKNRFAANTGSLAKVPFNIQKWAFGLLGILGYGITMIWWTSHIGRNLVDYSNNVSPLVEHPSLIFRILYNTFLGDYSETFYRGFFGTFSTFQYKLTVLPICIIFVLLLVLLIWRPESEKKFLQNLPKLSTPIFTGCWMLFLAVICYVMYTSWSVMQLGESADHIDGIQGRYFTITLLLFVPLGAWVSKFVGLKFKKESFVPKMTIILMCLLLTLYIFQSANYTISTTYPTLGDAKAEVNKVRLENAATAEIMINAGRDPYTGSKITSEVQRQKLLAELAKNRAEAGANG
jgi:uncharacterized membrane protein